MGIAQKVSRDFSDAVRSRGQSYFAKGRVAVTTTSPGEVIARVRGTAKYRVRLRMRGSKLHVSCTCPYFSPLGDPCKHLWATILMADARGLLQATPVRPLKMVCDLRRAAAGGGGPHAAASGRGPAHGSGSGSGPGPSSGSGSSSMHSGRSRKDRHARGGGTGKVWVNGKDSGGEKPRAKAVNRSAKRLLVYVLDVPSTLNQNQVVIDLARRQRRPTGEWGPLKPWWHAPGSPQAKYDPEDRDLLTLLEEAQGPPATPSNGASDLAMMGTRRFVLRLNAALVVEKLARAGRLRLRRTEGEEDPPTMRWDDGPAWRFALDIRPELGGKRWSWRGSLRRTEGRGDRMDLAEPLVLVPGLVILGVGRAARFDDVGVMPWIVRLRHEKEIVFVEPQQDIMIGRLLAEARIAPSELLENMQIEEIDTTPRPCLTLRTPRQNWGAAADRLLAELEFDYNGAIIPAGRSTPLAVSTELALVIKRDQAAEAAADVLLFSLGFRESKDPRVDPGTMELPAKRVAQVTRDLVLAGWRVEAEGKLIRPAGEFKLAVSTGIDWFELGGSLDYGGQSLSLPDLLAAARRGETMVALGDGSMGMLPEDWLKKYGMLADLGTEEDGHLRFGVSQAGLLDSLLASQPEILADDAFQKVRQSLRRFEGVKAVEAPPGFHGELRPYQKEGLGWLDYLQKFEFGGILADDMGLGKTIQVLALLQRRRFRRQAKGPALAIVPRSLVFNWIQEAERFTPRLRVLDYTGSSRHSLRESFPEYDLIITTYGTLRTDIVELSQVEFDYVILDEAQAIKNADSQAAKAARLLRGRNRLAMTGTPIENHLGELWSIMEFLNPGMLGPGSVFKRHASGDGDRTLLAKSLRPFILRRTKAQVVKDLPEKTEQTLHCDMEPAQRQLYEQLRAHYRTALLRKETAELNRSKIEVLEALLRLRQAACHPGLIDPARAVESSAKLDMLLPQISEVVEEGHKALVFSQFTSFLSIVRDRLDGEKLRYEYLDGRTRNRAERVERFQNDPEIPIFLISLKAGGLGLNLTAADYVYLLDPWWNPAVEAQAIDRSHRIGQTQHVFAYRLICGDTVEEKILELQQRKRDLADAILNADNRLIQNLSREDLEFLLS